MDERKIRGVIAGATGCLTGWLLVAGGVFRVGDISTWGRGAETMVDGFSEEPYRLFGMTFQPQWQWMLAVLACVLCAVIAIRLHRRSIERGDDLGIVFGVTGTLFGVMRGIPHVVTAAALSGISPGCVAGVYVAGEGVSRLAQAQGVEVYLAETLGWTLAYACAWTAWCAISRRRECEGHE